MKKKVDIAEYAGKIIRAIPQGVLLNSKDRKFNSMVIGWGEIGTNWSVPVFTCYVRLGRFTRKQLDANPEFTVSIPLDRADEKITRVCGTMSGYKIDKVKEAGLVLEDPEVITVPGIRQYPLTLECKVLYREVQNLSKYPEEVLRFYPQDVESDFCGANKDVHVMYIGQIVDSYLIE